MSLSLLLEEYDVSTEEGLAKALGEIEKEEAEVDEALAGVLSRACDLEDRLRTASHAYTRLGEVKNDAQTASDMVDKTAALAKDVSAKVRQLDLARSRVAECQRRVHDLIDLQLCSAGVEAAIKAHDYETGAGHVARFLSMDPGSVAAARARGAPDPRHAMTRAADTLRDHLVRKFEEAARKDDAASVERLYKLFPQIGRAEEGVDLLAKYIAAQTEAAIKRASATAEPSGPAAACARVLQAAAAAVERARRTLAAAPPPPPPPPPHPHSPPHSPPRARLPRALALIQPVVSAACARALAGLAAGAGAGAGVGGAGAGAPLEPRAVEPALAELAAAINTITLYFAFLRRKTQMDAASSDEETQRACQEAVEKIIAESDLTRTAQDLLGQYLKLERYFLEENVNKAIKMATPQPGSTTSNLVDDIFFIAKKSIRLVFA
ncbi:unnamed protein product [Diatraea saccharalis]|uniref:Conserved oligomeric Golgi complex subunit 4 n=1 Tax=Diatraea saccharalis TaxID=40085 RepID=A0A9N9W9J4_9NEOP|nr:unnamed protein product [Diatraea saccharalis]